MSNIVATFGVVKECHNGNSLSTFYQQMSNIVATCGLAGECCNGKPFEVPQQFFGSYMCMQLAMSRRVFNPPSGLVNLYNIVSSGNHPLIYCCITSAAAHENKIPQMQRVFNFECSVSQCLRISRVGQCLRPLPGALMLTSCWAHSECGDSNDLSIFTTK